VVKLPPNRKLTFGLLATFIFLLLACGVLFWSSPTPVAAQAAKTAPTKADPADKAAPDPATLDAAPQVAPADSPAKPPGAPGPGDSPASINREGPPALEADPTSSTNEIHLSFQGANIEMVVQWLAKT